LNKKLLLGVALVFVGNVASATPTVDDTTISWPDDGWYQVQDAATYSEVCAGGRSCSVDPGAYVVINHSTGERFRGIVVGEVESSSSVVVSSNSISWPDDGWYQVQDATTYAEVCAGGRSCSVDSGTYVVINHSTGERFRGITVGEIQGGSSVVVSGNTISWPDDGWYQVQDEATHTEVCGGGRSCSVESGIYVVINHSTGERFNDVVVSSNPQPVESLISLDSYEQILRELITLINATPMAETLNTQPTITDAGITFVSVSNGPVEDEVSGLVGFVNDYSCDAGGIIEIHTFAQPGYRKLTFADCALEAGSFDGILREFMIGRPGRGSSGITATDYNVDRDDQTRTLSGRQGGRSFSGTPGRGRFWENIDFDAQSTEGILTLSSYELDATSTRPARANESNLFVSFDVTAPWAGEQSISVEATLQASIEPNKAFTWQTGEVVAVADDGSQLTLTPADAVQRTFNIELSGHDGVITRQWADGFEIFCGFTDIELCGNF
jgi:hypothetical protein